MCPTATRARLQALYALSRLSIDTHFPKRYVYLVQNQKSQQKLLTQWVKMPKIWAFYGDINTHRFSGRHFNFSEKVQQSFEGGGEVASKDLEF